MPTLVLTLRGPMQAWGTGSRFSVRQTDLAPSKSGVIGLVAAAQGLRRTEPLTEFAGLRFGVRADQPGRVLRDFQTARAESGRGASISQRYFLSDAIFLAALQSNDADWLRRIQKWLLRPVYPLYLGRRAFPPSGPIANELFEGDIESAFEELPWCASSAERNRLRDYAQVSIETRIDAAPGAVGAIRQRDMPVTFNPERREHQWREVELGRVWLSNPDFCGESSNAPQGSPFDRHASLSEGAHDIYAAFPQGD